MTRTYIDSGVLIAAARGSGEVARRAFAILDDAARDFSSSIFVQLETLPKARCYKYEREEEFYEGFFAAVAAWADPERALLDGALDEASKWGLSACDAIHVVAAAATSSDELVTSEQSTKPIHRTKLVRVKSIHENAAG